MMAPLFGLLGFFSIVLVLFMQWQIYVVRIALTFAISSLLIGGVLIARGISGGDLPVLVLGLLTVMVRGAAIPVVIVRSLHARPHRAREHQPVIPTASSIIVSLFLVLLGYSLFEFALRATIAQPAGFVPFALLLQGAFLIISRRNAYIQLVGYLVMENAVLFLGSMVFSGVPFIVEAGVILDLLGVVVISRIVMRLRESAVEESGYHHEELRG